MKLYESEPRKFAAAHQLPVRPLFNPSERFADVVRTTVRHMPRSEEVLEAIMEAVNDARYQGHQIAAILVGGRWYAALDGRYLDGRYRESINNEFDAPFYCDSEMERGVRLVLQSGPAFHKWIDKCIAADEKVIIPEMADLARRAPTDDGTLAVLADWLEVNSRDEEANDLRAAQKGFQLLNRLGSGI
jgi:hypothetical protein